VILITNAEDFIIFVNQWQNELKLPQRKSGATYWFDAPPGRLYTDLRAQSKALVSLTIYQENKVFT